MPAGSEPGVRMFRGVVVLCLVLLAPLRMAFALPPGFADESVGAEWSEPAGLTFDARGRAYVWERAGRVWIVENGVKRPVPLIDLHGEVGGWRDLGLFGFALHPDFAQNGYLYLYYAVDRHHLLHAGTASYDPNQNEFFDATIGRIVRYTARASDDFNSVDPASRIVLAGATPDDGCPILSESHGAGSLAFGRDGTLLASCGDGARRLRRGSARRAETFGRRALEDGIIAPWENVGAFRAQLVDSLSGKLWRIDPDTGLGVASNPFYSAANPGSKASRVWALGLRDPALLALRPGTGSTESADADPGATYLGDFGSSVFGDLHVVEQGGRNLGWPAFGSSDVRGATGGVWYVGSSFPARYRTSFFLADSVAGSILRLDFEASDQPTHVALFHHDADGVGQLAVNPVDGSLYYLTGNDALRRVSWVGLGNEPPRAVASANLSWGGTPLAVHFTGSGSSDPEGLPLSHLWSFGDGATSREVDPAHVFTATPGVPTRFAVELAVTDATGVRATTTLSIWVENSPPQVEITSPAAHTSYPLEAASRYPLLASAHDAEHGTDQLTCAWQTSLRSNGVVRTEPIDASCASSVQISPVSCEDGAPDYTVSLRVTDPLGLGASDTVTLRPACPNESPEPAGEGATVAPGDPGSGETLVRRGGVGFVIGTHGVAIAPPAPQGAASVAPAPVVVGSEEVLAASGAPFSAPDTNAAPQVAITSPANLSSFVPGDVFTLAASASDPEDGVPPGFHWEIQRISNSALVPAVFVWDGRFPPEFTVPAADFPTDHVSYLVKLTVSDALGKTASDVVHVVPAAPPANQAPVAGFTRSPASGAAPLAVSFDASASVDPDGDYLLYAWSFGDGASATGPTAAHTYASVATFDPVLVVTDAVGATAQASAEVSVTPPGLRGDYYDAVDFTDLVLTRTDETIDFDWSWGAPAPGVGPDTFSVRWTGRIVPEYTETYTFYTTSDNGIRLFVDDAPVIDDWVEHDVTESSGAIALTAGQEYPVRIDFYENCCGALARLSWSSASQPMQVVPAGRLLPPAPANAPPIAIEDSITVAQAGSVQIAVLANDVGPDDALDPTSVIVVTPPDRGITDVDPVSGVVTYTHTESGADTWDSFTYTVADASGAVSLPATVWLALVPPPQISFASPPPGQTQIGTTLDFAYALSGYQPLTGGVRYRIDAEPWITLLTPGGTGAGHKFFNNVIHDNSVQSATGAVVVEVGNCNDFGANGSRIHDNYVYTPNDSTPDVGWVSCSGAATNPTSYQTSPGLAGPNNTGLPGAERFSITADDILLYQKGSPTGAPATDYMQAIRPAPPSIGALDAGP